MHTIKTAFLDYLESHEVYEKRILSIICMPHFLPVAIVCTALYSKKCLRSYTQFLFLGRRLGSIILFEFYQNFYVCMKHIHVPFCGNNFRHVLVNTWYFENFGFHCGKQWSENGSKFNLLCWFYLNNFPTFKLLSWAKKLYKL